MKLLVEVEGLEFNIGIGEGYNDISWLASAASRLYSLAVHPWGNYKPALLKIGAISYIPHPRSIIGEIVKLIKKGSEIPKFYVEVHKLNMKLNLQ